MNKSTTEQENFPDMKFWEMEQEAMAADDARQRTIRAAVEEVLSLQQSHHKKKKHGKQKTKHLRPLDPVPPVAIFYGNSINFGTIGAPRKSMQETTREEITGLIRHYERLLAEKDLKINDLKSDLEIFMPVRDDWKDAV